MLQRLQTVWLFLAAACAFFTFKFSFFSGHLQGSTKFDSLNATSSVPILIVTVALTSSILIDIFLYKNRKLQLRLVLAAIFVSLLNIFLYYKQTQNFTEGTYDLTAIFAFAIPVLLFLASRGIYKDEKLVKSLNRLR